MHCESRGGVIRAPPPLPHLGSSVQREFICNKPINRKVWQIIECLEPGSKVDFLSNAAILCSINAICFQSDLIKHTDESICTAPQLV